MSRLHMLQHPAARVEAHGINQMNRGFAAGQPYAVARHCHHVAAACAHW